MYTEAVAMVMTRKYALRRVKFQTCEVPTADWKARLLHHTRASSRNKFAVGSVVGRGIIRTAHRMGSTVRISD